MMDFPSALPFSFYTDELIQGHALIYDTQTTSTEIKAEKNKVIVQNKKIG